jgi:hypothetical protein
VPLISDRDPLVYIQPCAPPRHLSIARSLSIPQNDEIELSIPFSTLFPCQDCRAVVDIVHLLFNI